MPKGTYSRPFTAAERQLNKSPGRGYGMGYNIGNEAVRKNVDYRDPPLSESESRKRERFKGTKALNVSEGPYTKRGGS